MSVDSVLDLGLCARVPVIVWGPPGVGKSAAISTWARRRGLRCWTVVASLRDPSDFGGLPVVDPDARREGQPAVSFVPPRFAVEAAEHGGLIFLDELTTAPPAVQAALLRAVLDRAFGDLQLDPARVAVVAAANPPAEAAAGWDLAAPLANRFIHHECVLQPEAWVEAFPSYWGAPPTLGFGSRRLDQAVWARVRGLVAAFIQVRPNLLLQLPHGSSQRGRAWASPRAWDALSRVWAGIEQAGATLGDALPLLAGCVGEGPVRELHYWVRELDLPDPEELLARPASFRAPERQDQTYAVLTAVTQAVLSDLTPERWLSAWRVLALAAEQAGVDIAAAAARSLARARRVDLPLPAQELATFIPALQAASLLGGPAVENE